MKEITVQISDWVYLEMKTESETQRVYEKVLNAELKNNGNSVKFKHSVHIYSLDDADGKEDLRLLNHLLESLDKEKHRKKMKDCFCFKNLDMKSSIEPYLL